MSAIQILEIGLLVWLALLALVVLGRILAEPRTTTGLLSANLTGDVAPERALTALLIPAVLGYYALLAINGGVEHLPDGRLSMPNVPEYLISLLTGGNGLYLAGKIARRTKGGVP